MNVKFFKKSPVSGYTVFTVRDECSYNPYYLTSINVAWVRDCSRSSIVSWWNCSVISFIFSWFWTISKDISSSRLVTISIGRQVVSFHILARIARLCFSMTLLQCWAVLVGTWAVLNLCIECRSTTLRSEYILVDTFSGLFRARKSSV